MRYVILIYCGMHEVTDDDGRRSWSCADRRIRWWRFFLGKRWVRVRMWALERGWGDGFFQARWITNTYIKRCLDRIVRNKEV